MLWLCVIFSEPSLTGCPHSCTSGLWNHSVIDRKWTCWDDPCAAPVSAPPEEHRLVRCWTCTFPPPSSPLSNGASLTCHISSLHSCVHVDWWSFSYRTLMLYMCSPSLVLHRASTGVQQLLRLRFGSSIEFECGIEWGKLITSVLQSIYSH